MWHILQIQTWKLWWMMVWCQYDCLQVVFRPISVVVKNCESLDGAPLQPCLICAWDVLLSPAVWLLQPVNMTWKWKARRSTCRQCVQSVSLISLFFDEGVSRYCITSSVVKSVETTLAQTAFKCGISDWTSDVSWWHSHLHLELSTFDRITSDICWYQVWSGQGWSGDQTGGI